jgi:hypothetical protein
VVQLQRSAFRATKWATRIWREVGREGLVGWHAFRRGVETGLAALGVDLIRIRKLIGHSSGVDDAYLDAMGLDLREAIARIPPITLGEESGKVLAWHGGKKS